MGLTLTLALLAGSNILLTLLIQWYVITKLGVGIETDALFAGMALPQIILGIVSNALTHVLVPLLATEDEADFGRNAWGFFTGVTGLFSVVALLLYLTAGLWVPLLVPGFSAEGRALTVTLTRIQLVSMVFTASVSVLWSIYHARQRFVWAELSPVISNFVALLLLIKLLPLYGVAAAAWVIVLRTALQVGWLLPGLGRWQRPVWKSPGMREAWRRIRPLLLGMSYYRTDPLVDRFLTSMLPAGGLSLLYIGQQIYGVANVVIEKAIAAPMVPLLAKLASAGDWTSFRRNYRKRLLAMLGLTLTGYAVLLLRGEWILNLVIGRGGVTLGNVHLLWWILVALVGFFVCGASGQITATTFYAMGDTRTPTRLSIWTYSIYIPVKVIVFLHYGLIGLALTTSIYITVNLLLQIFMLEKFSIRERQLGRMKEEG
ncbi:MAG TPA: lipid II flippase MurJ [Pyrinomonadaceae bacterium]|jgi:putative peptidoglycan lipid II flippase|nr:lipid II flippase MurJ [Pyrinomonadaceae bacterium]